MLPILIVHYFLSMNTFKKKLQKYVTEAWNVCLILIVSYFVTISEHSSIINDFLGVSSKRRLRISILLAVLADRGRPLCPLFLSPTLPVSLNFSRKCLIVTLLGGFLPGKSLLNCRWVRTTDFVAKYASTIFPLSCIVYRVVGSIDALGWKSKALSMTYLKMREIC